MKKIIVYQMVEAADANSLMERIDDLLNKDFQPYGNPIIIIDPRHDVPIATGSRQDKRYCQAMVRYDG